ncbi:50S ribosomal protein L9 [Telmatospirillum siberiense]|uniref:Large ribosomal subunit protein bL9 n=1 Tax=Telmatospirillum siberiense TaxID=382514 RepID=A0A2N3PQ62_9PROT|nr:50S ribosomal protein L9 [Telmatospirillum siberiense]PKU22534.1 50S ribosomal protein L9 [Telmatospirillum siberiense]
MDVILLERIEKLGQMGDTVKVKPGFARNYLLPQKKALRATKENQIRFESQRVQLEAQNLQRREEAQAVAVKLDGLAILIIRQAGEGGMLYGSVSGRDVADAVKEAGFTVERRQVALDHPIKSLGSSQVRVSLHPEVSVLVKVTVARSQEEAERAARAASTNVEAPAEDEEEVVDAVQTDDAEVEAEAETEA